jgi:hypothetical protein
MYLYLVQQLARQRDDEINRAVKYAHHRRQLRRRDRHPRGGWKSRVQWRRTRAVEVIN